MIWAKASAAIPLEWMKKSFPLFPLQILILFLACVVMWFLSGYGFVNGSFGAACGYHASDPVVMLESIARTKEAGIKIGAHPGLPDLMGFGRRNMAISPAEAKAYTLYQISALGGMCQANGMRLQHVKPHGALYNMAAKDYALSLAICEAIRDYDPEIIVMGLSGSEMIRAAKDCGLKP